MQMGEEIIEVLNYICEKFGIVIDWSNENVIPYLKILCDKLVQYEINTSIAWIIILAIIIALCIISIIKLIKSNSDEWCILLICLAFTIFGCFFAIGVQIFDIIECNTIPEKYIIEYISGLPEQIQR